MKRRWWFLAAALGLCGWNPGRATKAEMPGKPEAPRWLSGWEEGRKAARDSGKPIFVVFRCEH